MPQDKRLEVKSRLMDILNYGFPRAVGHTWTEINGVKNNPNSILIISDPRHQVDLPSRQVLTLVEIPEKLRGLRKPIVIDHFALAVLVAEHNQAILTEYVRKDEVRLPNTFMGYSIYELKQIIDFAKSRDFKPKALSTRKE